MKPESQRWAQCLPSSTEHSDHTHTLCAFRVRVTGSYWIKNCSWAAHTRHAAGQRAPSDPILG